MCYHETLECFYFIAMAIQARKKRTKAKGKAKVDGGKKKKWVTDSNIYLLTSLVTYLLKLNSFFEQITTETKLIYCTDYYNH